MKRCPITYEPCEDKYSKRGLKLFSRGLRVLNDFPYSVKEQIQLATESATKLSIQGVQPKLSVILSVSTSQFEIVESKGIFILKPPHHLYEELPQNEDLTMRLAKLVGIEVPLHALIYNKEGSLSYIIKRFDRESRDRKLAVEDFSQLLGYNRDTKYDSSMEKIVEAIDTYCSLPQVEKLKLFRLVLFNFLVGNEDMHLKNFSIIRRGHLVALSPAYDLLNTTLVLKKTKEEIALPLRGKKSRLNPEDLVKYYGQERLGLSENITDSELERFSKALPLWKEVIGQSFLSERLQEHYLEILQNRWQRFSNY
jgi:serine/threonine-protein kinase HipA